MIKFEKVVMPKKEENLVPIPLTNGTMDRRKKMILNKMEEDNIDSLVIYADLEHGSNFEYLVGFLPRFEEALLVLHKSGEAHLVLGNENLNKSNKARIAVSAIHMPHLSLPNQPMRTEKTIEEILQESHIQNSSRIGLVGWKNFTSNLEDNSSLFDLPSFIVNALDNICKEATFKNATYMFIGESGARTINNANEFAHYEFGAALAGNCMLDALNSIEVGKTEMDIAGKLSAKGQPHNIVTITATGDRFENANMYPSQKIIKHGDPLSLSTGFKGGLQSRSGYALKNEGELHKDKSDYLDRVAIPYFKAVTKWIESIRIGMSGKELYNIIEETFPKEKYGWSLNPGHLCGDDEWLASPFYPNSEETLQSGMLFQIDIIPSVSGYAGISSESGILLADKELIKEIKELYPEMWERIERRTEYMKEQLGINVPGEVLPTSNLTAFTRPFLLNKDAALKNI